jgi:predicted permease
VGAPPAPDTALDWRAAIFTFALAVVCGVGFSLAPALQSTKSDVASSLKAGSALQLPGYRHFGLRNLAVLAQVTGSLMLLLITGFLVIGLTKANSVDTRFDPKKMVLLSLDPVRDGYTPEKAQALFEKLPARLKSSGSVRSMALAAQPPFSVDDEDEDIQLTAENQRESSQVQKSVVRETVGAGYFASLDEPTLAGREFDEMDQRSHADGSKPVALPAILNERAARGIFGNGDAIGKHVRADNQSYEVVGIVRDLKDGGGVSRPVVYAALTQRDFARPPAGGITVIVRSDAGGDALSSVRGAIASIDPNLNLFDVRTLSEYLELNRYAMRSALRTYGGIGFFGLVLSAIGLAGVTAYAVARRRKEIGIRMALGARKGQVLRLVLREGASLIAVGTLLGFLGAVAIAKMLSALTSEFADAFKIGTTDPRLLIGAPLLLAGLALLACYVPARRAARIDPLKALRQE